MVSWTLAGSAANFATRPGMAGTRMVSESELTPVMAISSASSGHGVRGAAICADGSCCGSSNGRDVQSRPSGRVAASSQARVSASTSGDSVSATRA